MSPHPGPAEQAELLAALRERRAALDAQRQALFSGQSRAEHAREVLEQDHDDAPQREADRQVDLSLVDRLVVEAAEVDAALQRLADGAYGDCADCGEPIPLARLRAAPQALRCVPCEERHENPRPGAHGP